MSLLTKPIGDINWDDVEAFCQQRIPEGAFLDYKEDFPKNLEKTLVAMANTLGGVVLLGVEEDSESKPIVPIKGIDFKQGLSERVINIILSNITPPFIPEVQVARDAPDKRAAVIIRIPQSPQTPHAIAANTQVYYRTGNRNQPEALASIDRIEWLIDRRKKSEDFRERLYKQAEVRLGSLYDASLTRRREKGEAIEKIQEGLLSIYSCPLYPRERFKLPPEMMQIFLESRVDDYYSDNYFPIPSGTDKTRMVQDGLVSHLSGQSLYHTELNCFGLYFFRQSIVRDYPDAGRIIYDAEIFARLDEFVDSAIKYYKNLGYWGSVELHVNLEGIQGCNLYRPSQDPFTRRLDSPDADVRFSTVINAGSLEEQKPSLVLEAAQQIARAFGWALDKVELDKIYIKCKGKPVVTLQP